MKPKTFSIEIQYPMEFGEEERILTVQARYYTGCAGTLETPPERAEITELLVYDGEKDITDTLTDDRLDHIAMRVLDEKDEVWH